MVIPPATAWTREKSTWYFADIVFATRREDRPSTPAPRRSAGLARGRLQLRLKGNGAEPVSSGQVADAVYFARRVNLHHVQTPVKSVKRMIGPSADGRAAAMRSFAHDHTEGAGCAGTLEWHSATEPGSEHQAVDGAQNTEAGYKEGVQHGKDDFAF